MLLYAELQVDDRLGGWKIVLEQIEMGMWELFEDLEAWIRELRLDEDPMHFGDWSTPLSQQNPD